MILVADTSGSYLIKAIVLSLLGHLIIAQLFMFVWPLKHIQPRPQLIFFGAVLDESEVSGRGPQPDDQRIILYPERINYHPSDTAAPYEDREVSKPAYPQASPNTPIESLKFNYLGEEEQRLLVEEEPMMKLNLPETPRYQPLRLNLK